MRGGGGDARPRGTGARMGRGGKGRRGGAVSELFLVGNGAGFSGDRVDAALPVVRTLIARGAPAALFFEVLGERTVALAQLARAADPEAGFEPMLDRLLAPVLGLCLDHGIAIIGNFGGANPPGAARRIRALAGELGLRAPRIGVVEGDDVRGLDLGSYEAFEADRGVDVRGGRVLAANAYLDAQPIVEALAAGAEVVVTGRTGDPSLALAPLIHHFGWAADDWDRLAAGAVAGHLLECGAQLAGGVFFEPGYKEVPDPANIGFPIAEVGRDGALLVTKADGTGGRVSVASVTEQLLYEVHDPAAYVTPDVTVDMTGIALAEEGPDRVRVTGVRGAPRPERLKVTVSHDGGWLGEGEVSVAGPNCRARALAMAEALRERVRRRQLAVRARVDVIGLGAVHDNDAGELARAFEGPEPAELRVRIAAAGAEREDAEQAAREALAMLCCGPAGTGGARWSTVRRVSTRSCLVPRAAVPARGVILEGAA